MSLRILIILVLCVFGVAPLALLMAVNGPAMLERLDRAAQQESLSQLMAEQHTLNVRVERLKERISSLASLPGARDIIGYRTDHAINAEMAGKRFTTLVNKWFGQRAEVLEVRLYDLDGHENLHLARSDKGGFGLLPCTDEQGHVSTEFCLDGAALPVGTVRVSDIEVSPGKGDGGSPYLYGLSLVTPVLVGKGNKVGVLCCRINMTDFLGGYLASFWLDHEGNPLHPGALSGINGVGADAFPGLQSHLSANKAVVLSGKSGRKVAWQPIIFNANRPATLWVGHVVDRSDLEKWLEKQRYRVLMVVGALVLGVVFLAGQIALFVDNCKKEMLAGFDSILAGAKPKPFAFGYLYLREMRQMATELNTFAERYFEMRFSRQRAEDELRVSNANLEEIVERRTAELFATNEQLSEEVEERGRAEEELIRHRDHLEGMVRQRLVEVAESNEQLQIEMIRRKHAQESMRKNEARLRMILDSVPIGIFIVDRDKRTITYANPAAATMIGVDSTSFLHGKQCHSFFCEGKQEQLRCLEADVRFEQSDVTLKRQDGSPLSVLKTVIPLTIADRPSLLESITDITELKRMSTQNQTLQQQLLQSQKMEAVGVLAGGVAHDFNNLLTIIQGSADLALMVSSEERKEYRYLGQIKETTERAGDLVRQLLLFSRTQPMTLSVLRLNDVVEHLLKMLKRLIGEDIEIITELGAEVSMIKGNAANIEQVIMNLTVNGRDAMSSGGKLYIRTSDVVFDAASQDTVPGSRPGRFVCLEVADSGVGIDDESRQRMFEPFFTTKEAGKGTGLGLAVVYGIVKQHEGWINVSSGLGEGTSIKIYLPASAAELVEEVASSTEVELLGDGQRVLVVEDEETLRSLIADTLEQRGFTVLQAVNVDDALAVFERENGAFDLLFSDVVLPGEQNGIELADLLREKQPALPVILSSGYTDQKVQWAIIEERGFAFLQKPFNIAGLVRMVHETMQGNERA